MRLISRSVWRKLAVLTAAVTAFVSLSETRVLDSSYAALQSMMGDQPALPPPGALLDFTSTAYCKGTRTASGVNVRTGIAAADPKLLPVGSVLNLSTHDPKYDGIYTVMDTGPKIQGRILDLYMWSCHEALRFGRRPVQITVLRLGWDPQASAPTLVERLFRRREASRGNPHAVLPPPPDVPMPTMGEKSAPEVPAAAESSGPATPPAPAPNVVDAVDALSSSTTP